MITEVREIPRAPLAHVDDIEAELRGDILERARTVFGYAAEAFNARGPLARALAVLEIAPLQKAAVEQYMKTKERAWQTHKKTILHWISTVVWPGALMLTYYTLTHFDVLNWTSSLGPTGSLACGVFIAVLILGVLGGIAGNVYAAEDVDDFEHKHVWKQFSLGGPDKYEGYIPVHVLNQALQLKAEVPAAQFTVYELQDIVQRIPRPLPDPFLLVELGAEKYFIAVWDEREFEAQC
jgi:hypothetical protein